jgi:hypothetical protein
MEKILGEKILREDLVEKVAFHFKEVFEKEWEDKKLEDLIPEGSTQKVGRSCSRTL